MDGHFPRTSKNINDSSSNNTTAKKAEGEARDNKTKDITNR